jgi:hypothetical protein
VSTNPEPDAIAYPELDDRSSALFSLRAAVSMISVKREQDQGASLRFLTAVAAGRPVTSVPSAPGIASLATEHRLHGLVISALDSLEDAGARALREELALIDGWTWARHVFLATELSRVSSMLSSQGVEHYLMKGLAVETRFYDRMGERPSVDLDIVLLERSSIATALEALEDESRDPGVVQQLADEGWIQSVDVVLPSGTIVDLHIDPLKLGFQSRFSGTVRHDLQKLTIDGTTIHTLDATASLLVALLHLNRNRFRHLSGFADVARILTRSEIEWPAFNEHVTGDGLEVLIDGSLRAVRDQLDLDSSLVSRWASTRRLPLHRAMWRVAWRPSTRLAGTAGRFRMGRRSQFLMPALCRRRLTWSVRWMVRRLFPPSRVVEFNHSNVSGRYLVRLVRGRWREIRHTWSHRRAGSQRHGRLADEDLVGPSE